MLLKLDQNVVTWCGTPCVFHFFGGLYFVHAGYVQLGCLFCLRWNMTLSYIRCGIGVSASNHQIMWWSLCSSMLKYNTIIKNNSFLVMEENYAFWQLSNNSNLSLQLDGAQFVLVTLAVTVWIWISWVDRYEKKEELYGALVPLILRLLTYYLVLYSQSDYAPRTQSRDHGSNCRCYKGHVAAHLARGGV